MYLARFQRFVLLRDRDSRRILHQRCLQRSSDLNLSASKYNSLHRAFYACETATTQAITTVIPIALVRPHSDTTEVNLDDLEWLGVRLGNSGSDSTPRDNACGFLSHL